jgi:hypothetical protein
MQTVSLGEKTYKAATPAEIFEIAEMWEQRAKKLRDLANSVATSPNPEAYAYTDLYVTAPWARVRISKKGKE